MVDSSYMNAMYDFTSTTASTSFLDFEIASLIDASDLMRILVENGYRATLTTNSDQKNKKKKPYVVQVVAPITR